MTNLTNDDIYFIPLTGHIGSEILEEEGASDVILNFGQDISREPRIYCNVGSIRSES